MSVIVLGGREIWLRRAAVYLQMDPGYLSKIVNGKRDPRTLRVGTLLKLKELFEFETVDDLIAAIDARRESQGVGALEPSDSEGGDTVISSHRGPSALLPL